MGGLENKVKYIVKFLQVSRMTWKTWGQSEVCSWISSGQQKDMEDIDSFQEVEVYFVPTTQPTLMTVKVVPGNFPIPLVMNPGVWSISIKNTQYLFLVSLVALLNLCLTLFFLLTTSVIEMTFYATLVKRYYHYVYRSSVRHNQWGCDWENPLPLWENFNINFLTGLLCVVTPGLLRRHHSHQECNHPMQVGYAQWWHVPPLYLSWHLPVWIHFWVSRLPQRWGGAAGSRTLWGKSGDFQLLEAIRVLTISNLHQIN